MVNGDAPVSRRSIKESDRSIASNGKPWLQNWLPKKDTEVLLKSSGCIARNLLLEVLSPIISFCSLRVVERSDVIS